MKTQNDVEVSNDALGFFLAWTRTVPNGGPREGEPVTTPMSGDVVYFKTKAAAQRAAKLFNAGETVAAFNGAM